MGFQEDALAAKMRIDPEGYNLTGNIMATREAEIGNWINYAGLTQHSGAPAAGKAGEYLSWLYGQPIALETGNGSIVVRNVGGDMIGRQSGTVAGLVEGVTLPETQVAISDGGPAGAAAAAGQIGAGARDGTPTLTSGDATTGVFLLVGLALLFFAFRGR